MGKMLAAMVCLGLLLGFMLPNGESRGTAAVAPTQRLEVVLTRGSGGHFFTDAKVNGKADLNFMVDTGASMVALTMADASKLGIAVDPADFTIVGEGAGGPVRGINLRLQSVEIEGIRAENVEAVILESSQMSLLGQAFLANVDEVSMSGDYLALRDGA